MSRLGVPVASKVLADRSMTQTSGCALHRLSLSVQSPPDTSRRTRSVTKGVSMPTIPMAATPVQRDRSRDRVWCAVSNSQQVWASASAYPTTAQAPQTRNPRCLRSEEHTSELQSRENLVCRLLLE